MGCSRFMFPISHFQVNICQQMRGRRFRFFGFQVKCCPVPFSTAPVFVPLLGPHKSRPDPAKRRPLPDGVAHQQRVDLPPQGGPFRFVTRHRARENPLCVNRRRTARGRLRGGSGPSPTPDLAAPPVPAPGRGAERRPAFLPSREKIFVVTAGSPPGPGGRGLAPVLVTRGVLPAVMCGALCGVWRSPAGAISHCFRYGLLNTNIC